MDLVLALWAYSSRRQHPPPPAWPIRVLHILAALTPHPHTQIQIPPAWLKGVVSVNILVTSLGEICSIYSLGRLGLSESPAQLIKVRRGLERGKCGHRLDKHLALDKQTTCKMNILGRWRWLPRVLLWNIAAQRENHHFCCLFAENI